jgi:hypothetical protein
MTPLRLLLLILAMAGCDAGGVLELDEGGRSSPSVGSPGDPGSRPAMAFLTSETYTGDLRSSFGATTLDSADAICSMHASVAGLGGTWVAWLSSREGDILDRLQDRGPWVLTDGQTVAISSMNRLLIHGPDVPIALDEYGELLCQDCRRVWTGTDRFGRTLPNHCNGWSWTASYTGSQGVMTEPMSPTRWTDVDLAECRSQARLLCIEQ